MAGPIVLPYGVFPMTDANQPIWSDDLHQWLIARYRNAKPIIEELGEYAGEQGVKVAVEPVDHWETPAPNMVREVMQFVESVSAPSVGVCIDSAHVVLGSHGPSAFAKDACHALEERRLHYVHISAPDRGAVHDSWIPWGLFLRPILDRYTGPLLVEVFNAIPVFLNSLRLTRRKFWVPGEDTPEADRPSAFDIARRAIEAVHHEVGQGART
jgi:sugar phosphate isomerase/epimerase